MEEGQINPAGGAPVLPYATGRGDDVEAEWKETAEGIEIRIPPPELGRQVVLPALGLAVALPLFFFAALGTAAAVMKPNLPATLLAGAFAAVLLRGGLVAARRLVRVARWGTRSTFILSSPDWLTLVSPWLPEDRPYRLPRFSITGFRIDEVSAVPSVARFARVRVIFREKDVFDLRFPWRGNFPLSHVEWRFHDALGLGPRNFSPPVAAVQQQPTHAQTDPDQARVAEG